MEPNKISQIKEKTAQVKADIRMRSAGYILTALGLVAGLAWNDAIGAGIKYVFPLDQNGIWAKFVYAVIVTLVVVFISNALLKFSSKEEN